VDKRVLKVNGEVETSVRPTPEHNNTNKDILKMMVTGEASWQS